MKIFLLFLRVQQCYDNGQTLENDPNNNSRTKSFEILYLNFPKTVEAYNTIIQDIVILKQKLFPDQPVVYDSFEELYGVIEYYAAKLLPKPTTDHSQTVSNSSSSNIQAGNNNHPKIHMPKIELVKFDGEDIAFKAEKLNYLLGSLSGKALKTCNNFEAIPSNYDLIWHLLEETYNDKKYLDNLYLDRLWNFKGLSVSNPSSLHTFLEKFDTNVTAIKRLNLNDLQDYILYYIAISKLPQETINSFELIRPNDDVPKYDELIKFIRHHSRIVVKPEKTRNFHLPPYSSKANEYSRYSKTFLTHNTMPKFSCLVCPQEQHYLKDCNVFKSWPFDKKFKLVKDKNLCINCFSNNHRVGICPSKFRCSQCHMKRHTLLHKVNESSIGNCADEVIPAHANTSNSSQINPQPGSQSSQMYCTLLNKFKNKSQIVVLSTVVVRVIDKWNKFQNVRMLLDNGSMSNLLTMACC
ncbi:unnamed protein product [Psylliodes chrysocephalus]|uniref:Uncharacterized protein n=1 Tax=Psylliodes chrysocephalus TaxID=3402493 RepID=A0A9P0GH47_9CUCU|nr:unnamed protein product [Psylliodes chrysocephala]